MTSPDGSIQSGETRLVLFSRPDCHLCDVAAGLIRENDHTFRVQNIEEDLALIRRYGTRIPVLFRPDTEAELFWPFDDDDLDDFLG